MLNLFINNFCFMFFSFFTPFVPFVFIIPQAFMRCRMKTIFLISSACLGKEFRRLIGWKPGLMGGKDAGVLTLLVSSRFRDLLWLGYFLPSNGLFLCFTLLKVLRTNFKTSFIFI